MPEDHPVQAMMQVYQDATTEEKAFFAVEALPSLLLAVESTYGHHAETQKGHHLKVFSNAGGEPRPFIDKRPLKNGDLLDLLILVPRTWVPVWIEGLPEKVSICAAIGSRNVGNAIEIAWTEKCLFRWPLRPSEELADFVNDRMEHLKQERES